MKISGKTNPGWLKKMHRRCHHFISSKFFIKNALAHALFFNFDRPDMRIRAHRRARQNTSHFNFNSNLSMLVIYVTAGAFLVGALLPRAVQMLHFGHGRR